MKKILLSAILLFIVIFAFGQNIPADSLGNDGFEALKHEFDLNAEIERQSLLKNLFLIGFVFSLLIIGFIIYFYNVKIKQIAKLVERQNSELKMAQLEARNLGLILHHTENGVVIANADGKIEWANKAFAKLHGINFENIEKSDFNILEQIVDDKILNDLKNIKEKKVVVYSTDAINRKGETISYQRKLIGLPDDNGEIMNYIAIDVDLTTLRLSMDKMQDQKEIIGKHTKEIEKNVYFAKFVQSAFLPTEEFMKTQLPSNFLIYKPKDVVSGDFYWARRFDNILYVAAADCSGHNVQGAFLSVMAMAMLNDIVNNKNIATNNVLSLLHKYVKNASDNFAISNEIPEHAINISICRIDLTQATLQYSGADANVYLIRKKNNDEINSQGETEVVIENDINAPDYILAELKADKLSIGKHPYKEIAFKTANLKLTKGDSLYLFSDGYFDQFGGKKGGKFLVKNFKSLILSMQDKKMYEQKFTLETTLDQWRKGGNSEKIYGLTDDIMILGLRFNNL